MCGGHELSIYAFSFNHLNKSKRVNFACMHDMQVQKHLQMRVEAQGKYMQSIVEKAYQALGSSDCATWPAGYRSLGSQAVLDIGTSSTSFSSVQDLQCFYGGSSHMDQLLHQMERPMDGFLTLGESCFIGSADNKKGPNHCSSSGKSSMTMWASEEQQQQQAKSGNDQLQMGSSTRMDGAGTDVMDPVTGLYEGAMSGDSMDDSKGFEGLSSRLEMKPPAQQAPVGSQRILRI